MPGLFDMLPKTEERVETIMRKALEARREAWAPDPDPGYIYRGGADYILTHGTFFSGAELPPEYEQHKGPGGHCFENALAACKADPTLRYFEGVYNLGAKHPTPHAWALAPDGRLLEFTFPTDPQSLANGRHHDTRQPILPVNHWGYWGVEFDATFVEAYWVKHNEYDAEAGEGHVGIFDRPTHDSLDGESYDEWRDTFPIFTYPYDRTRTEP